ncbi:MAG: amino acid decarboxylase [Clostridia bacterium]|nr:amino acid decarboxylase [Clostridia bacterium]
MNTPIYDFVSEYIDRGSARLHMPGHKGRGPLGCEERDITEVGGADVLYSPTGIIEQSERGATSLFNTSHTYYSTEGSTLAIKAMLAVALKAKKSDTPPTVVAARNAHKAFVYAAALLGIDIVWMYAEGGGYLGGCYTPELVKNTLSSLDTPPMAVYITSPDYLGGIADIAGISRVCEEVGIPLLVDNAHGAYLAFLEKPMHPIALGAAMCTDSAHKTLPVLTGGAYLHISKEWESYNSYARECLSLFASTSPSYLILQSLDLCNRELDEGYAEELGRCVNDVESLKAALAKKGIITEPSEPLKITLSGSRFGMTGYEIADILEKNGIVPEFADRYFTVLMISPSNTAEELRLLEKVLLGLPAAEYTADYGPLPPRAEKIMSARDALLAPSEAIASRDAVGRICADPSVNCPPAVPIVVSGERITEELSWLLCHWGVDCVKVVKGE